MASTFATANRSVQEARNLCFQRHTPRWHDSAEADREQLIARLPEQRVLLLSLLRLVSSS